MQNNPYDNVPDINFVPLAVEDLVSMMVAEYEKTYEENTGEKCSLPRVSEERFVINAVAVLGEQINQSIDEGLKQNLAKYSSGRCLDNLAAFLGVYRLPAQESVCTVRFTLSAARAHAVTIPQGTRVSTAGKVFFTTVSPCTITAGATQVDCAVECMEAGSIGNEFEAGQIYIMVDPVPYVASVANVERSQGGADIENDESLRYRLSIKPSGLSVAGPAEAYEYFIREYSQAVECVGFKKLDEDSPTGVVEMRITLAGGEFPSAAFIQGAKQYLESKRPMTSKLVIEAPDVAEYTVNFTYYISRSDYKAQQTIADRVAAAVTEYNKWQCGRIGRDIVADKLKGLVMAAGAKRAPITTPVDRVVADLTVCKCTAVNIVFGGVEDD